MATPTIGTAISHLAHHRLEDLRPSSTHRFTAAEEHEIMDEIYARGDRLMIWFLGSHMALALVLALYHGTWLATLTVGGGAWLAFMLSVKLFPRTFFTRAFAGVAQQAFVALHIYQLYGQSEQHFWYFTAFTMMIVYQDWLCMWPGALLIIAQHSIFAFLHNTGMPVHFFPEPHVGFDKLFYHFGIALVQVCICGYWAHLLRVQSLGDTWRKLQLSRDQSLLEDQLTQLRKSEQALTESSEALTKSSLQQRAILDNSPDAMWVKDLQGHYVAVNSAFARFANKPFEIIEGKTVEDLLSPSDVAIVHAQDAEAIATRASVTAERALTTDIIPRIIEVTITPVFDAQHNVTGTTGIARDITERKRLDLERQRSEARMQHAQKLESLGLLAGGIAHDFNNLLVGILANAELAKKDVEPNSAAGTSFSQIELSALRAADLTRQMLAYAGKGKVDVQQLDMSNVVRDMVDLLRTVISKKATFRLELDSELPLVEADATQLRQVIMNLITNASDALEDSAGLITLRTAHARIAAREIALHQGQDELPAGDYVVVEVSDTGVGMNEETQAKMFEPFYTTKFVGRGLGLAAVLGILRSHHGAIEISSEPEKGSAFRMYLPALMSISKMPASVVITPVPTERMSTEVECVLVVDDEPTVRSLASRVLSRAGHKVLTANDGVEAIDVFHHNAAEISVVLLDMLMPRMNGEETFRELRKRDPEIPVLFTSGFSEEVADQKLLSAERVGFIQKPYGANQLLATIHELVDRRRNALAEP